LSTPSPEEILSVTSDNIPAFIQRHADAKTLSEIVKRLNQDLMMGDETVSGVAARALHHMGFVESA